MDNNLIRQLFGCQFLWTGWGYGARAQNHHRCHEGVSSRQRLFSCRPIPWGRSGTGTLFAFAAFCMLVDQYLIFKSRSVECRLLGAGGGAVVFESKYLEMYSNIAHFLIWSGQMCNNTYFIMIDSYTTLISFPDLIRTNVLTACHLISWFDQDKYINTIACHLISWFDQDKCGSRMKEVWPYIKQEIKPTLDELGILTPEEMGYDKPELAMKDVYDM